MIKPKVSNRKIQAAKTKQEIYDVSIRLIEKYGYDNVTIEKICKTAGVSVGTFYIYFATKSAIFNEIYRQGDEYFEKEVACQLQEGSALEKIRIFFKYYAQFNMNNGLAFIKILYQSQSNLFINKDRFMVTLLRRIVDEGQSRQEITVEMEQDEIVSFLFMFVRGIIFDWCLHDGSYNLTEKVVTLLDRILFIVKSDDTRPVSAE